MDTRRPREVEREVSQVYSQLYGAGRGELVSRAFRWVEDCFAGRYDDYQAIDTRYHDLEHTLQGTLCFVRLLQGRHRAAAVPAVDRKWFELGLVAILFHDTGYLKRRDDIEGTGAKYTLTHVGRSAAFARDHLGRHDYGAAEIAAVQNMIRCTGIEVDMTGVPFSCDLERILGASLGTADLLGQMAADDYVDKLPALYQEFAEAARFSPEGAARLGAFGSAEDLVRKTPGFWSGCVWPRLQGDFGGLYAYLNDPYPGGPNIYLERIACNLDRIRRAVGGEG